MPEQEEAVLAVHGVGGGDVDGVHLRVGGEGLVRGVAPRHPEPVAEGIGRLLAARAHGGEFGAGVGQALGEDPGDAAGGQDAPADGIGHVANSFALSNILSQGLNSRSSHSGGRQLSCTTRKTRSGWGIMIVTRPSALDRAVTPPGEPLGLAG